MTMQAAWRIARIAEWTKWRAVLARELNVIESAGNNVLRGGTTSNSIKNVRSKIAVLDAVIEGRSP
jgi:hypothetical protein